MAVAAVIGHIFPIYAGFRGGKGVATTLGIIMGISPPMALLCIVVFWLVLLFSHYVSLASLVAVASFPLWMNYLFKVNHPWLVVFSVVLPLLVLITHRKNILRLLKNEESAMHVFQKKAK
jgi:glycerol-3-phosphate acyltransferase PlsY